VKNTLIVQIDGLSYDLLNLAIKKSTTPFLSQLAKQGYEINRFYSGLPSTTPAAQISLLYGISNIIPAYRFIIKKENIVVYPGNVKAVHKINEAALRKNPNGLLKDGAGILTIFSGGSKKGMTVDNIYNSKFSVLKSLFYLINPVKLLFFMLKAGILMVIDKLEQSKIKKNKNKPISNFKSKIKRVFEELFFGEIAYSLTKQSIINKIPVIYVDFPGYDEVAHFYGPASNFAFYYLQIIDMYIKRLFDIILEKSLSYEVIILSDHGQTSCIAIKKIIGVTLGEKILSFYPTKKIIQHEDSYDNKFLKTVDLYLLNSGGLGLLYYPKLQDKATKSQMEKEFPDLCRNISNISGVGLVIVRDHQNLVIKKGISYEMTEINLSKILPGFIDSLEKEKIFNQLIKLLDCQYGADVYIIGEILDKNKVVTFEDHQFGTHGCLGGLQTKPFFMSKAIEIQSDKIRDIGDVYSYLYNFIYSTSKS